MQFTTESENYVQLEGVNLMFPLGAYREESIRKKMISFLQNPVQELLRKKHYLHVLNDVSLNATRGDRIAIIGKNGAGKTTLCRVISGVYKPHSGRLSIKGEVRSILDPGACIYPELTGRENARILLQLLNIEKKIDVEGVLNEALEFSGLGYFVDIPVRLYSTGMYTRLCLSVVTALPADILILDEVFDGADIEFSKKVGARILKIISDANIVFFVSHSLENLRNVCNKGLVLHNGQIVYSGPIEEAIRRYSRIPGAALGHDQ